MGGSFGCEERSSVEMDFGRDEKEFGRRERFFVNGAFFGFWVGGTEWKIFEIEVAMDVDVEIILAVETSKGDGDSALIGR